MASQAAQFDLTTSFLDQPEILAYGLVRGAGNKALQQELTDKSRICIFIHGSGEWDSILRLWINNKVVGLPSANVHFHPGGDGEIGFGMGSVSTGADQHVDAFWASLPVGLDPLTLSRMCYTMVKVPPDPGAPSADLTFLADFQAMKVRQFDSSGNQTGYAWTQNWAWIIADFLIRKFILREGKTNQPLVAAELARFDWPAFAAAATYYDAVLSGGQKRFSDGGVVYLGNDNADRAQEQLLLMSRSWLLEPNGKFSLRADKPRSWVYTFTSDNTVAKSVVIRKANLQNAPNRLTPTFRDLNIASGSTDDATRFAIASDPQVNHEAHQRTTGVRGAGLAFMPNVRELVLDLGVNTPERVERLLKSQVVRQFGDDVDANSVYNAPWTAELVGYEDSLRVENGDVVLLDRSLGEEVGSAPKRSDATRIQSAGGAALDKFLCTVLVPSVNGQTYEMQLTVTNNGLVGLRVYNNFTGQVVNPGETQNIFITCVGNGAGALQFDFRTLSIGDLMDCVARDPLLRRAGVDENLLETAGVALDFTTGWAANSGAVVTITQGAQLGVEPFRCEMLEIEDAPDGTRKFMGLEYMPNAFPDTAGPQQGLQAPDPGNGLPFVTSASSVANADFEAGDRDWTKGTGFSIVNDPANAYGGAWAGKFVGTAAAALRNSIIIPVKSGDAVLGTAMVKRTAGDATQCAVRISWLDSSFAELSTTQGNSVTSSTYAGSRVLAVSPAPAFWARIEGVVTGMTVSTTVYFDQFAVSLALKDLSEVGDSSTRFAQTTAGTSYRPLSNPLTGHDAGSNATVNIGTFTMRIANKGDFTVNSGSVAALSYDTLYYIYYDDSTGAGGSVSYNATTTKETALNSASRFYVGSIRTPVAVGEDTVGNNDGGATAQAGYLRTVFPTIFTRTAGIAWTNEANANDRNTGTKASSTLSSGSNQAFRLSGFADPVSHTSYESLVLKVRTEVVFTAHATSTDLRYSLDGGVNFTAIYITSDSSRALTTDVVVLPINQDLSKVVILCGGGASGIGASGRVDFYEAWIEAQG